MQRFHRDLDHRWFAGVCAGIALQFGLPRWFVRLLWVILTPFTLFLSVLVYVACAVVIPTESEDSGDQHDQKEKPV